MVTQPHIACPGMDAGSQGCGSPQRLNSNELKIVDRTAALYPNPSIPEMCNTRKSLFTSNAWAQIGGWGLDLIHFVPRPVGGETLPTKSSNGRRHNTYHENFFNYSILKFDPFTPQSSQRGCHVVN